MLWQNKVSVTELIWAYAIYEMQKEEGDELSDAWVFLGAGYATLGIWIPEGRTYMRMSAMALATPYVAPLALAITGPVAIGTAAAYAIGGKQGLEDYYEFLTEPKKMIKRTQESIRPIEKVVSEEIIQPYWEDAKHGFNWIMGGVSNWAERQVEEAKARLPAPF
jgi:hypothetical protein